MDIEYFLSIINSIIGIIAVISVIIVGFSTYLKIKKNKKTRLNPFSTYEDEVQRIKESLEQDRDISISSSDKQFLLLKEYHAQGLAQSKISFWFSIIFATIGFVIIFSTILNTSKSIELSKQGGSIITLISGIIIEAVSALFFVQSNKSRDLMSSFFDKLRSDRKLDEAISLSNQIPDEELQSKLKMILALNFAQVSTTDNVIAIVLKEINKSAEKED